MYSLTLFTRDKILWYTRKKTFWNSLGDFLISFNPNICDYCLLQYGFNKK